MAARILPFPRRDAWGHLIREDLALYACSLQALEGPPPPAGTPPLDPQTAARLKAYWDAAFSGDPIGRVLPPA